MPDELEQAFDEAKPINHVEHIADAEREYQRLRELFGTNVRNKMAEYKPVYKKFEAHPIDPGRAQPVERAIPFPGIDALDGIGDAPISFGSLAEARWHVRPYTHADADAFTRILASQTDPIIVNLARSLLPTSNGLPHDVVAYVAMSEPLPSELSYMIGVAAASVEGVAIVVDPAWRRDHAGTSLLAHLRDWLYEKGRRNQRVRVLATNVAGVKLLLRCGYFLIDLEIDETLGPVLTFSSQLNG